MKKWIYVLILLGLLIMLSGCEGFKNPISTDLFNQKQARQAPTQPSDDTAGSDIFPPPYPEGTTVIVSVGDSITYGIGSTRGGYPAMLGQKLRNAGYNIMAVNEGIPGATSPDTDDYFLELIVGADIVTIMIGTNDVSNPGSCPNDVCNTIEHFESMIDKALISNVVPIVSLITPKDPRGSYSEYNPQIRRLNEQITQVCAAKNVVVVDNYAPIMSGGGSALFSNKHHLNDRGYNIVADQFYDAIVTNHIIEDLTR